MAPSDFISAKLRNSLSSTSMPAHEPSSSTPTKITPGFWFPGRSFANAHTSFRMSTLPAQLRFRSTVSDSNS